MRQTDKHLSGTNTLHALWDALDRSHAILIYDAEGTVLEANAVLGDWLGYPAEEFVGKHYDSLCADDPAKLSWHEIADGKEKEARRERRRTACGATRWFQSRYSPVFDNDGTLARILQITNDVTERTQREAESLSWVTAISDAHAVVTFDTDGLILDANERFLAAMGYLRDDIVGRHHRMFVEPSFAHSAEYALFWRELSRGRFQAGQYRRFAKDRSEVWIQASYNPVFDADGQLRKIIKLATIVTEEKLRQAEHQGQIAAIHNALGVISFDMQGYIRDANDNFLESTGYRLSEVKGRHHRMFLEPEYAASEEYRAFWANLSAGRHQSGEFKRIGKHGNEIWLQATYNPVLDLNGHPFRVVKYATVVTEQRLREADLQGQIAAIDKSQGLISFDLEGTILSVNDNFCRAVGYAREELIGQKHQLLLDNETAASADYTKFWDTLRAGIFVSGLYRRIGKGGRTVWIQASYNPILDLNGFPSRIVKVATDVTSMAAAFEDAKRQSLHDPATALPNRVRLLSFMNANLAQPNRQLTILYLDLDRFKPINDSFGHDAGDHVLGQIADRLRQHLTSEQLAARIGGDEFIVAAPDMRAGEAEALCIRLLEAISAPIRYLGDQLDVGVSIGVATSIDGITADELLRRADVALYRSKQNGRGTYCLYAGSPDEGRSANPNAYEEMHRALAAGEFVLEYQPRYDSASRRIVRVEALVRWQHPERGIIPPLDFIGNAERCGFIVNLGEWILRQACYDALAWPGIGISVNISSAQLQSGNFVETVAAILQETGLDPARLELELTETVVVGEKDLARDTLTRLKQFGLRVAMDDFGTGNSTLSTLRAFPFDAIKIDRQFVHDLGKRDGGREVVQAILALARALGLTVTADGVETTDQASMLTADQCNELQGFVLARPMRAEKLSNLLDARPNGPPPLEVPGSRRGHIRRTTRKRSSGAAPATG